MDVNEDLSEYEKYKFGGEEGPLKCIFFCEFHPTAGPIISCCEPEGYISKELFDSISVYIITKSELHRSTITVTLPDHKILGFPISIDDKKYARNAYLFNLCFVCDSNARAVRYEPVVTKLSDFFINMELESSFLSQGDKLEKLKPILKQVLKDLNDKGECILKQGPIATHLKVVKIRSDPNFVADHIVPIFIKELPEEQWDLTTQQVTPYIDGFNHVLRIAALSDVDKSLVKACIQNLMYYGVVALVPIFQYGNVYCTTPKLKMLAKDYALQQKCLMYVANSQRQLPHFKNVFRMYSAMTTGTTVKDLCMRFNPSVLHINERKLVQFGVLEEIIHRVHKYPVHLSEQSDLPRVLSGASNLDEICSSAGISTAELEDQLERDHNVVMLWK